MFFNPTNCLRHMTLTLMRLRANGGDTIQGGDPDLEARYSAMEKKLASLRSARSRLDQLIVQRTLAVVAHRAFLTVLKSRRRRIETALRRLEMRHRAETAPTYAPRATTLEANPASEESDNILNFKRFLQIAPFVGGRGAARRRSLRKSPRKNR